MFYLLTQESVLHQACNSCYWLLFMLIYKTSKHIKNDEKKSNIYCVYYHYLLTSVFHTIASLFTNKLDLIFDNNKSSAQYVLGVQASDDTERKKTVAFLIQIYSVRK